MIAANYLRGDHPLASWSDVDAGVPEGVQVVDVRNPSEVARGHVEGALNIPVDELRDRLPELPQGGEYWLYCQVGQRAYYATRTLLQHGRKAKNLSGGFATHRVWPKSPRGD